MKSVSFIKELTKKECVFTFKSLIFILIMLIFALSCFLEFNGKIKYLPLRNQSDLNNYNSKVGSEFIIENATEKQKRTSIKSLLENSKSKSLTKNKIYLDTINNIYSLSNEELINNLSKFLEINDKEGLDILAQVNTTLYSPQSFIEADLKTAKEMFNKKIASENLYLRFTKSFASTSALIMMFYIIIIFSFTLEKNKKDNIEDVINITNLKSSQYLIANFLGKLIPVILVYLGIGIIFNILAYLKYKSCGLEVSNFFIAFKYLFLWSFISITFMAVLAFFVSIIVYDSIVSCIICFLVHLFAIRNFSSIFNYEIKYSLMEGFNMNNSNYLIVNRLVVLIIDILLLILSCKIYGKINYNERRSITNEVFRFVRKKFNYKFKK